MFGKVKRHFIFDPCQSVPVFVIGGWGVSCEENQLTAFADGFKVSRQPGFSLLLGTALGQQNNKGNQGQSQEAVSGNLASRGTLQNPTQAYFALHLDQFDLTLGDYKLSNSQNIQIEMTSGHIKVVSLQMEGSETTFSLSGELELFKQFNLLINARTDLNFLRNFSDEITKANGPVLATVRIQNDWDQPTFHGNIKVEKGSPVGRPMT